MEVTVTQNTPQVKSLNKPKEITLCILKVTALALATLGLMALAAAGAVFFFPPLATLAVPTAIVGFGLCAYFIATTIEKIRKNKPLPQQQTQNEPSAREQDPIISGILREHAQAKMRFQELGLVEYKKYTQLAIDEIDLFQTQLDINNLDFATNCTLLASAIQNCNRYIELSEANGIKEAILKSEEHRTLLTELNTLIDKLREFQGSVDQSRLPSEYDTLFQALLEICSTALVSF